MGRTGCSGGRLETALPGADVLIVVAGALTVVPGVLTVVAGVTTTGTGIAGRVTVDRPGAGDVVPACGAGSGAGWLAAPDVGAFSGAGPSACPRVAAMASAAAGQLATTRTRINVPQIRATM